MKHKKQKHLTRRQLAVIDELFAGGMDEIEVLARHNVSTRLYRAWLGDELFADELRFRIDSARRTGELIIARYAPVAAAKLVGLIDSNKAEICRRACLDIMLAARERIESGPVDPAAQNAGDNRADLPPALATKLLAVLAQHADNSAIEKSS
jgi:hypothetical protein